MSITRRMIPCVVTHSYRGVVYHGDSVSLGTSRISKDQSQTRTLSQKSNRGIYIWDACIYRKF